MITLFTGVFNRVVWMKIIALPFTTFLNEVSKVNSQWEGNIFPSAAIIFESTEIILLKFNILNLQRQLSDEFDFGCY
jgi:hypothetical protein